MTDRPIRPPRSDRGPRPVPLVPLLLVTLIVFDLALAVAVGGLALEVVHYLGVLPRISMLSVTFR